MPTVSTPRIHNARKANDHIQRLHAEISALDPSHKSDPAFVSGLKHFELKIEALEEKLARLKATGAKAVHAVKYPEPYSPKAVNGYPERRQSASALPVQIHTAPKAEQLFKPAVAAAPAPAPRTEGEMILEAAIVKYGKDAVYSKIDALGFAANGDPNAIEFYRAQGVQPGAEAEATPSYLSAWSRDFTGQAQHATNSHDAARAAHPWSRDFLKGGGAGAVKAPAAPASVRTPTPEEPAYKKAWSRNFIPTPA